MSDFLEKAAAELTTKLADSGFDGSAKFDVAGIGAIVMDADGVRVSDDDADVTFGSTVMGFDDHAAAAPKVARPQYQVTTAELRTIQYYRRLVSPLLLRLG